MRILVLTGHPQAFTTLASELSSDEVVVEARASAGLGRAAEEWALILIDPDFASGSGLEVLKRLAAEGARAALTARSPSIRLTVEAISAGARDVFPLPPSPEKVRDLALRCARDRRGAGDTAAEESTSAELIGESPAMLHAFKTVARVAARDVTVLIRGESGTGKELLARAIHEHSPRAARPFVAINCAAIPDNLLESELFGHEKGAFTGALGRRIGRLERANGGTLFLDEIGDMSLPLQAKILRVLQEREIERVGGETPIKVDVRIIAATHRDLEADVAGARFREDLYYRLAVVTARLPPLRERGDDIRILADHYLALFARIYGRPVRSIGQDTLSLLRAYRWPGNVRQLRNVMEHGVLVANGEVLLPAHLPPEIRDPAEVSLPEVPDSMILPLAEMERRHIRRALQASGGHMARTAEILGIHRNTLRRKLAEYGLE